MRLVGESGLPQRAIEELAGAVAGKRTAGAIRAVSAGRKANNEKARGRIAETRHRPAPVFLPAIGASLHTTDLFTMRNQTRTSRTTYYFGMENAQSGHR
jgi:hypothetical protein